MKPEMDELMGEIEPLFKRRFIGINEYGAVKAFIKHCSDGFTVKRMISDIDILPFCKLLDVQGKGGLDPNLGKFFR